MTSEERDALCYCDEHTDLTKSGMCHHCEKFCDERSEEHEENSRKRIAESLEY